MKTVAVSGGFDPLHIGHVRMFERARKLGDRLVVILNNDHWLRTKKGFVFMPEEERKEILLALSCVDEVRITEHTEFDKDRSVCRALRDLKPNIFANGGDRVEGNVPEADVCAELGIKMVYGMGGEKVQSSSWLTSRHEQRPWGSFTIHIQNPNFWVKTLRVDAGKRTSLQSHKKRTEYWLCTSGEILATKGEPSGANLHLLTPGKILTIEQGEKHRLATDCGGSILEIAYGEPEESDIHRYADDYGRA